MPGDLSEVTVPSVGNAEDVVFVEMLLQTEVIVVFVLELTLS